MEIEIDKWRFEAGLDIKLANVRYADDLMTFATSREEMVFMVETLAQELFSLDCSWMAWKRWFWGPLPYLEQEHHMLKYVGLSLLFCMAKRHTNIWAANSRATWILELRWTSSIAYNVHASNFISTNWYCWINTCLSNWGWNYFRQLFSRLLCLVGFTAADAKIFAEIGRGTTRDAEEKKKKRKEKKTNERKGKEKKRQKIK